MVIIFRTEKAEKFLIVGLSYLEKNTVKKRQAKELASESLLLTD